MNNCKIKTVVVMLVLFGMGAVSGWFASRYDSEMRVERQKTPQELTEHILKKFGTLGLTREQLTQIRPMVAAASAKQVELQNGHWKETMVNFRAMNEEIKPLLNQMQIERIEQAFTDVERQRSGK